MQYPITIGTVGLSAFEVPSSINFGGTQRLAVHRLFGGGRVVEALGPDPNEIWFEGAFTGADASVRARTIENLRMSGTPVWLTWDTFRYYVVIQALDAEYRSPWWIAFRIVCVVASSSPPQPSALSVTVSQIASDATSILTAASGLNVNLSGLQTATGNPQVMTPGTAAQIAALSALGQLTTQLSAIAAVNPATFVTAQAAPAARSAQNVNAAVAAAGNAAAAAVASGYLSRLQRSISGN